MVEHELAHVRNRDVDLTALAVATWWAALAVTVPPVLLVAVRAPDLLFSFGWRLAGLMLVLWLLRASVLRVREYYADARAAVDPAAARRLADVLRRRDRRSDQGPPFAGLRARTGRRLARLNHPSRTEPTGPTKSPAVNGCSGSIRLRP
ncbi:MAG TPA: hypothetical protein VGD43_24010 [Micromonospora sp.]